MNIDSIVYQNIQHLLETTGITERQCILSCKLNSNFFSNYRKGVTKHFKVSDIYEIAAFFDVDANYLLCSKNIRDDFFVRTDKINTDDTRLLFSAIKKLDFEGRTKIAELVNKEMENTKRRKKLQK